MGEYGVKAVCHVLWRRSDLPPVEPARDRDHALCPRTLPSGRIFSLYLLKPVSCHRSNACIGPLFFSVMFHLLFREFRFHNDDHGTAGVLFRSGGSGKCIDLSSVVWR